MSRLQPVSWPDFVRRMRHFGFAGPYRGGKHPYLVKAGLVITIPNPHRHEIGIDLLVRILRQAGISRQDYLQG